MMIQIYIMYKMVQPRNYNPDKALHKFFKNVSQT